MEFPIQCFWTMADLTKLKPCKAVDKGGATICLCVYMYVCMCVLWNDDHKEVSYHLRHFTQLLVCVWSKLLRNTLLATFNGTIQYCQLSTPCSTLDPNIHPSYNGKCVSLLFSGLWPPRPMLPSPVCLFYHQKRTILHCFSDAGLTSSKNCLSGFCFYKALVICVSTF